MKGLLLGFLYLVGDTAAHYLNSGCSSQIQTSGPQTFQVPFASTKRPYLLHLPTTYDSWSPQPLIISFHGKGQTASQFSGQTQLTEVAFNSLGAVVAFPQGLEKQWLGDPTSPPKSEVNDIAYAGALLKDVTSHYCIDLERIYIVGFSNGGGLTQLLACDPEFSKHIAAAAIVSGAFYKDKSLKGDEPLFDVCEPARSPVPILEMHGSADPIIHYDGKSTPDGETYPLEDWIKGWKSRNGCGGAEGEKEEVYMDTVEARWWFGNHHNEGEDGDEVVVHYLIKGFGHGWPSMQKQDDDEQRYGPVGWNATTDILDFFGSNSLPIAKDDTQDDRPHVRDEL